ncbi:MAG TPA: S1C family serine protease [Xanthobacteraceae bacterium]|nr:S1C family serine protease [Xanthobacteraceae bacterium]
MTDAISHAPSQIQSLLQFSNQLAAIIAAAAQSVVAVHGGGRRPSSGIVWQPGVVVTAEETVTRDGDLAVTLPDGNRVQAILAGRDPSTDIAVLSYESTSPPTAFASTAFATDLRAGHLAVAIGRTDGGAVATLGIVSFAGAAWRSRLGGQIDARLVIDARLPAVAEGGAVIGADGSLIGIPVFGPRRRVLAIPAATIARIVPAIRDKGHIARGYLGVGLQRVPLSAADGAETRRGAMVVTLDPVGPAKTAGILQGDIIVGIGGGAVTGLRSLYQQLGPDAVGKSLAIELIRAGARMTVDVTISPRPQA